ncbi:MAG: CsbD family protein [Pseudonocardiales bacterium]
MATEDKAAHKATELKGKIKQGAGELIEDEELQAEGEVDEAEGKVKQAGDKLKDAAHKIL